VPREPFFQSCCFSIVKGAEGKGGAFRAKYPALPVVSI
jgi:hypothetical protein